MAASATVLTADLLLLKFGVLGYEGDGTIFDDEHGFPDTGVRVAIDGRSYAYRKVDEAAAGSLESEREQDSLGLATRGNRKVDARHGLIMRGSSRPGPPLVL